MTLSLRVLSVLLLALIPSRIVAAAGQDAAGNPTHPRRERLIGLLDLPEMVSEPCGPEQPVSVPLFATPSATSPPIGSLTYRVTNRHAEGIERTCDGATLVVRPTLGGEVLPLPTKESGYEIPAAIVYQRSHPWYRIALPSGSAWIKRTHEDDFQPYPALLRGLGGHLVKGWGGKLWRTPGSRRGTPIPKAWRQYIEDYDDDWIDVEILGERRIGGELWIHVEFARRGTCADPPDDFPDVSGWIPAYRPSDGDPNLWFYSRGC